ncbi:MAG: entericidin A/B family lipoprotein [Pyrinomonadaceae bacterium]|nr:entericidin A/B family lipoprotein [Phycisphaerales bacterium]
MNNSRTRTATGLLCGTFVLSILLALVGCNTVEGVGKDVKSTGKGLEEAAQDAK